MQKSLFSLTKTVLFSLTIALSIGYSSNAVASLSTKPATPTQLNKAKTTAKFASAEKQDVTQKVMNVYRQWAGTRYRLGGESKAGIDCSAFVQAIMDSAFSQHFPRSTAEQRHMGKSISKSELRPGDLVFFRKNNHVGVYIGNGKFVHASSSQGVTTSSMSERYWAKSYTQSRRVL
ncbi:NlpC/P60 family protein [Glaesserella parasuis]|nr:NlpC/P60 family protein [Glaesserella parasuis]